MLKRQGGWPIDLPRPDDTDGIEKSDAKAERRRLVKELAEQQERLYADRHHAVLVVLQGMDASGKDGTVRHVFSGVNPQGVHVHSFKEPTPLEHAEDFLWRVHDAVPPKGYIGIFNRSHYEDVLVVRVHETVPEKVWRPRYRAINDFERMLAESGVVILKFFLHISKEEQAKRFAKRIKDERRHWKFSAADLRERELWDKYRAAYEDVLRECSTDWAPWRIVPSDHKWYRNLVVARHLVKALKDLDLHYPAVPEG